MKVKSLSLVWPSATPWTAAYQAPPSMGFSRQEYWSGVPLPSPGLVRSLQPPDILWIHWRVYNSIANTSKGVLFLPPSDVYVRSFLYLLYTWIKLYYTEALSSQASSLALDWILLWRPRILESLWFNNNLSTWNNRLVPNWERSVSRLYIVTVLI